MNGTTRAIVVIVSSLYLTKNFDCHVATVQQLFVKGNLICELWYTYLAQSCDQLALTGHRLHGCRFIMARSVSPPVVRELIGDKHRKTVIEKCWQSQRSEAVNCCTESLALVA